MSVKSIQIPSLGQDFYPGQNHFPGYVIPPMERPDIPVPVSPQPVLNLPDISYEAMGKVWNYLNEQCHKMLTPAQCRALLGSRPIVITEGQWQFDIKWYWWVILGFILGRITKRIL